tara:strand:- start:51 stop:977 length:927 start_codon:yes stop_codon:yes gene_type:complete
MKKYRVYYLDSKELNIGADYLQVIDALNEKNAYEKFINKIGIYQKAVCVTNGSSKEIFTDHFNDETNREHEELVNALEYAKLDAIEEGKEELLKVLESELQYNTDLYISSPNTALMAMVELSKEIRLKRKVSDLINKNLNPNLDERLNEAILRENRIENLINEFKIKTAYSILELIPKSSDDISPLGYELYLAKVHELAGYHVEHTGGTGDGGVDLILTKNSIKTAVQAKRYSLDNKVGVEAVQQVFTGKALKNCDDAIIFTTSEFTPSAIKSAEDLKIKCVDHNTIRDYFENELKNFTENLITQYHI